MHLSWRLKCTIVITRCPTSVRPSLTFHIFDFSSETAERNSTKLDRKQDLGVLYQVCVFGAYRKNNMAALASDGVGHFRHLLWNHGMEFNETWHEARSRRLLPSLCFSCRSEKKMAALAYDWLRHFRLLLWNCWTDFKESWREARSQHLPSLCFGAERKNKMAALASDWLRHFRLSLWHRWKEFNQTWHDARFWRPLSSLRCLCRSEKEDGRPGLWLVKTFSTSPLKPLNRIRNLSGSNISTSSTKFVFLGRLEKQYGRPGLWLVETCLTSHLKLLNGMQ